MTSVSPTNPNHPPRQNKSNLSNFDSYFKNKDIQMTNLSPKSYKKYKMKLYDGNSCRPQNK